MFVSNNTYVKSYPLSSQSPHPITSPRRGARQSYTEDDIRAALQAAKADESLSMASLRTSDTPPKHAFTNPFLYYVIKQLVERTGD